MIPDIDSNRAIERKDELWDSRLEEEIRGEKTDSRSILVRIHHAMVERNSELLLDHRLNLLKKRWIMVLHIDESTGILDGQLSIGCESYGSNECEGTWSALPSGTLVGG